MQEDCPPTPLLYRCLHYCPLAGWIYFVLWRGRDANNVFTVYHTDIFPQFFVSPTIFKNRCRELAREGLVSVDDHPNMYRITLETYGNLDG